VALRTQQVIGHESGVADTIDPLAGSYFVEYLTDEICQRANEYIYKIDEMGGALAAIEMDTCRTKSRKPLIVYQREN